MRFGNPYALVMLAIALPLLAWLYWRAGKGREKALRLPWLPGAQQLPQTIWLRLRWLPRMFRLLAIALVVVALARPQTVSHERPEYTEGIDVVIALDVSTSMNAADFQPVDRITVAREVIKELVNTRKHDRIGLVVFARDAFTQCPLTLDYRVLLQILESVRTGVIEDGTAIGNGLGVAINRLRESEAKGRAVILLTDGDNNSGNIAPEQAGDIAKELGIQIFAIQVGKGGKVPYPSGTDIFGKPQYQYVDFPVNPKLLRQLATVTGGKFYIATDKNKLEKDLHDVLDTLEKTKLKDIGTYEKYTEFYAYALAPALIFWLLDLVLVMTRLRAFP